MKQSDNWYIFQEDKIYANMGTTNATNTTLPNFLGEKYSIFTTCM